jgi:hypothetical protein
MAMETARTVEKGLESLLRKAWSVMDAAAEKQTPSQYLSDVGIRAMQGKLKE